MILFIIQILFVLYAALRMLPETVFKQLARHKAHREKSRPTLAKVIASHAPRPATTPRNGVSRVHP